VKVEELKSMKCTTKKTLFKQAKKQDKHKPFILPPVTKQSPELDTKVIRPKLGDKVDVSSNFTSNLTHIIRSHCGSIQKEKIATKATRSVRTPSSTLSNESKSSTTLAITTSPSSFIPSNNQRCYVEDFMKLNINQPCTILVPCKDSSLCSRYYHLLQSSDGVQIVMGSFTFHVCYVTVKRNDDLVRLQSGLFTQVDMKDSLFNDSKNKNNGVYVLPTTNDDIEVLLTWKDVLNGKNTGIQVWITKQYIRDPYPLFYANRKNVIRMDSILFNLVHEVYYDLHQMQFIYNSYLRAMSNCKQARIKGLESKVEKLDSMLDLKLDGSVFDTFLLKIDSTFKDAIES